MPVDPTDPRAYGEAFADVYDAWYGDLPGRDEAVERLAALVGRGDEGRDRAGGPAPGGTGAADGLVLELAVGTGRLALPLATRGVPVVGVDASAAMLARLRAKDPERRVGAVRADLAALPLRAGAHLALAFVAASSLFNLWRAEDQHRCLDRVGAALAPGGALVVEAFVPDPAPSGVVIAPRRVGGGRATVFVTRAEPEHQVVESDIVELGPSGVRRRPVVVRPLLPDQLDQLAAAAGLALESRWADWAGSPYDEGSVAHVSTYRRPAPTSTTRPRRPDRP